MGRRSSMLVKNIKHPENADNQLGLTIGKLYPVISIVVDHRGRKKYVIVNDHNIVDLDTSPYFVTVEYPAELFEVVDETIPENWRTKTTGWLFKRKETTFPFFLEHKIFSHRMVDGSEPERSFFFHELQALYDQYNLGTLIPRFPVIPKSHLENIKWPKDIFENWVDPEDRQTYESTNHL